MTNTLTNEVIKESKSQLIYKFISDEKSVSKQDIAASLKLSLPTITQNLRYLVSLKLIDTSTQIGYTGGRNATAYTHVPNAKIAIGLYLSTTCINAVAINLSGEVVYRINRRMNFALDEDVYLKEIGNVVKEIKETLEIPDEDFLGVGVAVPGLVSEDGEEVIYGLTLKFTGKRRSEIAKYIPYRNYLFHDSRCAGLAEIWSASGLDSAYYFNLSNSIGGCIIIDNQTVRGDNQRAGEIGHMIIQSTSGKPCYCGQKGCFDSVCNITNLVRYSDDDLKYFFELLERGDHTIVEAWNQYLDNLAIAIHNIRVLFDCPIILGGYVGEYIDRYMEQVYEKVNRLEIFDSKAEDYVFPCQCKIESTATGAALKLIEGFIQEI